jgi:transposase InsO family protein
VQDRLSGVVRTADGKAVGPAGPAWKGRNKPATVYHTLLDEGVYLCSVSSMYRILREHGEVRERRRQAVHPPRVKPELVATQPNQVWSWDIERHEAPLTEWR